MKDMLLTYPGCKKPKKPKNLKAKMMAVRSTELEHSTFLHVRVTRSWQENRGE